MSQQTASKSLSCRIQVDFILKLVLELTPVFPVLAVLVIDELLLLDVFHPNKKSFPVMKTKEAIPPRIQSIFISPLKWTQAFSWLIRDKH